LLSNLFNSGRGVGDSHAHYIINYIIKIGGNQIKV